MYGGVLTELPLCQEASVSRPAVPMNAWALQKFRLSPPGGAAKFSFRSFLSVNIRSAYDEQVRLE